ncbi:MFS transporter, FLVCR family, feline leukemia virus subgroup C receptor-related protein [Paragonimus westermani]|uniref:MFS transporter, FLVCR family, feline leukemia virus subgroup C receptor-related protein n=1 Tax=Paragonimus westermani TaxID=34504 RepID=A0A5J4NTN9_9TREM|nr:MFS transporter, FLVCR family, feline leukemia virus subgroup C receptor-related protein [Paragonimus westermani]
MPMELEKPFVGVLYKKRWIILFIFSLCSMSNSYHWIHLNIISDRVLYIWNATIPGTTTLAHQMAVDWLSMVYLLAYIPLIVPATWLLERFGLRATTLLAVILNVLGAWLKCVAGVLAIDPMSPEPMNPSKAAAFPLLMFAQTLDAIAQVYILGVPAQLAATWFGEKEISTATSIGVLANQLGVAIGFCIPPEVVRAPPPSVPPSNSTFGFQNSTDVSYPTVHRDMMYFLYISAAVNTLPILPVLFFFKSEPPTQPTYAQHVRKLAKVRSRLKTTTSDSLSTSIVLEPGSTNGFGNGPPLKIIPSIERTEAITTDQRYPTTSKSSVRTSESREVNLQVPLTETDRELDQLGFKQQLFYILRNPHFVLLVLSYGINTGVYYAVGTLLNVILQAYFPNETSIGWIGFTMIMAGIVGSVLAGTILDRSKRYK